ncbi:MAG: ATPase, partial [Caulobacteraceae bacterium]|nr:ATPase [Caulobacteraceae bacterium]
MGRGDGPSKPVIAGAQPPARGSTASYLRIAVLSALMVLAIYTVFGVVNLRRDGDPQDGLGPDPAAQAEALAARAEGAIGRLDAALSASGAMYARLPSAPMDAAEAGLSAAGPAASAV